MGFFEYFQLAAVAIVLCVIVIKAAHSWHATGVNPIVIGRGKGAWQIIEGLSFLASILWIIELVLRALRSRFDLFPGAVRFGFVQTRMAKASGVVLITLGMIPFILAYVNFGTSWRIGIDRETPGDLVTAGIFAATRNPIYVAFIMFCFGIFLINGTWFFLIFALVTVVAIHFQVLREEAYLKNQYGQSYEEYRSRTARYLIW